MTTESDRELLELAARAHGCLERVGTFGWIHVDSHGQRGAWWSPLTDDGDALRLAVKLEFDVTRYSEHEVAVTGRAPTHGTPGIYLTERQPLDSDPYAATRRAIVRAAAEVARATHKEQT